MAAKKFNHKRYCASHVKVEGYTAKVCVLKGQEPEPIIGFAVEMVNLAIRVGRFLKKPGGTPKKPSSDIHNICGGHFEFPGFGKVCYGKGTSWTEQEARAFCKELGHIRGNNPRYDMTRYDLSKWSTI
jgi:hypothetical protein